MLAAELIAPLGGVIISDQSEAMLAGARARAAELELSNVEFQVLNAEWIDLPLASVDAVLCRWGYMLMADPRAALTETRRVLRPHGRLALAVWDAIDAEPLGPPAGARAGRTRTAAGAVAGHAGPFALGTRRSRARAAGGSRFRRDRGRRASTSCSATLLRVLLGDDAGRRRATSTTSCWRGPRRDRRDPEPRWQGAWPHSEPRWRVWRSRAAASSPAPSRERRRSSARARVLYPAARCSTTTTRIYRLLDGKTVAIIGYGSQGHAHALNLQGLRRRRRRRAAHRLRLGRPRRASRAWRCCRSSMPPAAAIS